MKKMIDKFKLRKKSKDPNIKLKKEKKNQKKLKDSKIRSTMKNKFRSTFSKSKEKDNTYKIENGKGISIKLKIPIVIGVLVLVSIIITNGIVTYRFCGIMMEKSKTEIKSIGERTLDSIDIMLEKQKLEVELMTKDKDLFHLLRLAKKSSNEGTKEFTEIQNKLNARLSKYTSENSDVNRTFLVTRFSKIVSDSDSNMIGADLVKLAEEDPIIASYNGISASGAATISQVRKVEGSDKVALIFTSPIIDEEDYNSCIGYIAMEIYVDVFTKYLEDMNISNMESSFATLIDKSGKIIYHNNPEKIGEEIEIEKIKNIVKDVAKGKKVESDIIEFKNEKNVTRIGDFEIVRGLDWVLLVSADKSEINKPVMKMILFTVILTLIIILITISIGTILSIRITAPIARLKKLIDKTANLDLNDDDQNIYSLTKSKDELADMAKSIIKMREVLREVVESLRKASSIINENAARVENNINELRNATEETSMETQNLSSGMEETAATAEEISASSNEIGQVVNKIVERSEDGSKKVNDIVNKADNLKKTSIDSKNNTDKIFEEVKSELENAIEKSKEVEKIHSLAQAILQITSQTNLLALNAAIEAARAGDAGRGFAVVAEEVRKLAEESGEMAGNIQNVVKKVNSSVKDLADSSSKILMFFDKYVKKDYETLIEISQQYSGDALEFDDVMAEFNSKANEIDKSIEAVITAIEGVTQTMNGGAEGISVISNKTINIVDMMDEIKEATENNKSSAEMLNNITDKFKL